MNIRLLAVPALAFALTACCMDKQKDSGEATSKPAAMAHHESMWESVNTAVAVLYPTKGNSASGTITFTATPTPPAATPGTVTPAGSYVSSVHVHGTITGLEPNSTHAFHIHEFGDASSPDGMSAGGHFNPEHHQHGSPTSPEHHAGDLGNVTADASGSATIDLDIHGISIAGLHDPIIGRGLVLHAKPDDFSQPVGNAGGRIAVGVIGIAKSPAPAK